MSWKQLSTALCVLLGLSLFSEAKTPATLANLTTEPVSKTQINISWSAATDADEYQLEFFQVPTSESGVFADVPSDGTSPTYQHTDLMAQPMLSSRRRLLLVASTGAYSDVVTATTQSKGEVFSVPELEDGLRAYPNPTSGEVRCSGLLATRRYLYKSVFLGGTRDTLRYARQ